MEKAELLVDHYQKTYELTFELWKQRNVTFLVLLGVIAVATLLTFGPAQTNPLLIAWIAKVLGITEGTRIEQLQKSFPFAILQSLLLVVVFYLIVNLYHRALYVLRNYRYLGELEREIRSELNLPPASIAFTRESTFYWGDRAPLLGAVKWVYIIFVGTLLFAFLGGRTLHDFRIGNALLGFVDLTISTPTVVFFAAYAYSSVSLDSAQRVLGAPPGKISGLGSAPDSHATK
jgi:hypothetical protein